MADIGYGVAGVLALVLIGVCIIGCMGTGGSGEKQKKRKRNKRAARASAREAEEENPLIGGDEPDYGNQESMWPASSGPPQRGPGRI